MNLPRWAVRRPIAIFVLVLASLVVGCLALPRLSLEFLPQVSLPYALVATLYPGADPATVEQDITAVIEGAARSTARVERVESLSADNVSLVVVAFQWGTDPRWALEELRARLDAAALLLPPSARKPVVLPVDPSQLPVMTIALRAPDMVALTRLVTDQLQPRLAQVPGVGQVMVAGGLQQEIEVLYHSDRLRENGLTPAWLHQLITLQNVSIPAGSLEAGGTLYTARVGQLIASPEELADLVVGERKARSDLYGPAGLLLQPLHLRDVADVRVTAKSRGGVVRIDGEPALLLRILGQSGANAVQISAGVRRALEAFAADHPHVRVDIVSDQANIIRNSLRNLTHYGIIGAVLASATLVFFIRNGRALFIIASAIPLSVFMALIGLYAADMSLNVMSLGGLALATGMLLDNAIIVVENIVRLRREGLPPAAAASRGAREMYPAVVASTVTTLAVFVPASFVPGWGGLLLRDLGVTVSIALIASLFVSMAVVPALAARLLRGEREGEGSWERVAGAYRNLLARSFARPGITVALAVLLFALSIPLWSQLDIEFLPSAEEGFIYLQAEAPPGTPLAETLRRLIAFEERLRQLPGVRQVLMQAGEPGNDDLLATLAGAQANNGSFAVAFHEGQGGLQGLEAIRALAAQVEGLEVHTASDSRLGPVGDELAGDLIVRIQGPDGASLNELAEEVKARLASLALFPDIVVSPPLGQPQLLLDVNRSRSLLGGLTAGQVALAVRHAISGEQVATLRLDGQAVPVRVRPHPDELADLPSLMDFRVSSPVVMLNGENRPVRLSNISEPRIAPAERGVRRLNGQRLVEVRATLGHLAPAEAKKAAAVAIEDLAVPPGVTVTLAGAHAVAERTLRDLLVALVLALGAVYAVLAIQFESWVRPLIVMVTVPLAAVGAAAGLYATGQRLSATAFLGVIMLGGLVVNNGIVMLDCFRRLERDGLTPEQSVLAGAVLRLRPILMTAATTLLGLVPMVLARGAGTEFQRPLAIALGGGLFSSTLLTLFVVPCLYRLSIGRGSPPDPPSLSPRPRRPLHPGTAAALSMVALLLGTASAGASGPQEPSHPNGGAAEAAEPREVSEPAVAAEPGETSPSADSSGAVLFLPGRGRYVLRLEQIKQAARSRGARVHFRLYSAPGAAEGERPATRVGLLTDWYRPVSLIGYHRVQGSFFVSRMGSDEAAGALTLESRSVLGNIDARIEVSYVDSALGTVPLHAYPVSSFLWAPLEGVYQLKGELREGRNPNVIWTRAAVWSQPVRRRSDGSLEGGQGSLILSSGSEVRSGPAWLIGKAGVMLTGREVIPVVRAGVRFRSPDGGRWEIGIANASELSQQPSIDLRIVGGQSNAVSTAIRAEIQEDGRLVPSVQLGSEGGPNGIGWHLLLQADRRFLVGLSTGF